MPSSKSDLIASFVAESRDVASNAFDLLEQFDAPILIARAPRQGGSIVASSDLRRAEHPVLREAVGLGRLLGKRVTFEVLLSSFGLETDSGLAAIAAAVHYLWKVKVVIGSPVYYAAIVAGLLLFRVAWMLRAKRRSALQAADT